MFAKEFYPTPYDILDIMFLGLNVERKNILDPSSGDGRILKKAKELSANPYGCEIEERLYKISANHGSMIGKDFLNLDETDLAHIDIIIMNPPFSNGSKHILHAYEKAKGGTIIHALCNASNLEKRNRYDKKDLYDLVASDKAIGTYENLGTVFKTSERYTDVEVALIKIEKPKEFDEEDFSEFFSMDEEPEEMQEIGLKRFNKLQSIVNAHVASLKGFQSIREACMQFNALLPKGVSIGSNVTYKLSHDQKGVLHEYQDFKRVLTKESWKNVFKEINMDSVPENTKKTLLKQFSINEKIPFTMKNIWNLYDMLNQTKDHQMLMALKKCFEEITEKTFFNKTYQIGYVSNDQPFLAEKFILSRIIEISWSSYRISTSYGDRRSNVDTLNDFMKACCYFLGRQYITYSHNDRMSGVIVEDEMRLNYWKESKIIVGEWIDWGFLEIKFYKNGNAHIRFKKEEDRNRINLKIAESYGNQLPKVSDRKKTIREEILSLTKRFNLLLRKEHKPENYWYACRNDKNFEHVQRQKQVENVCPHCQEMQHIKVEVRKRQKMLHISQWPMRYEVEFPHPLVDAFSFV